MDALTIKIARGQPIWPTNSPACAITCVDCGAAVVNDDETARETDAVAEREHPAGEQGSLALHGKELALASPDSGNPIRGESLALVVQLAEEALASQASNEGLNPQKKRRREKMFQALFDRLKARLSDLSLPPGTLREDADPSRLLDNNVTRARCLAESKEELDQLQRTCRQRSRELEAHEDELRRLRANKRMADAMHTQLQRRNLHPALQEMLQEGEQEGVAGATFTGDGAGGPQGVHRPVPRGGSYNPTEDVELMDAKRAAALALGPIDDALSGVAARLSALSELVETLDTVLTVAVPASGNPHAG
eukprot:jgi/Mesvir1/18729/Mv01242-RA.1